MIVAGFPGFLILVYGHWIDGWTFVRVNVGMRVSQRHMENAARHELTLSQYRGICNKRPGPECSQHTLEPEPDGQTCLRARGGLTCLRDMMRHVRWQNTLG